MTNSFVGLLNNMALLLVASFLFDLFGENPPTRRPSVRQISSGFFLGVIGVAVMSTPWELTTGLIFDARSILLAISGLFFGATPAAIAVVFTAGLRIWLGGSGTWAGVGVILSSAGLGLLWRHQRKRVLWNLSFVQLYLFGLLVHVVMLAWMLSLPSPLDTQVIKTVGAPVMLIHPAGTALLGWLFVTRLKQRRTEKDLAYNESLLRTIAENYPNSYLSVIKSDYSIGFTAASEFKKMGLNPDDFIGLSLEEVFGEKADFIRKYYEKTFAGAEESFEIFINDQHQKYNTMPFFDKNGKVSNILSVVENITDRVLAEKQLRESEERYRMLFERATDAIFLVDVNRDY